jgi:hypothetical protein
LVTTGANLAASAWLLEEFVRRGIGDAVRVPADRLNPSRNEAVTLVGLDGRKAMRIVCSDDEQ